MKSLSILPFPIKYIFAFLFIISNANADIKSSPEELDFLIKIGALNGFSFTVENNNGFNRSHEYEEDGTAYEWECCGWGVAYSITSLDNKIATKTKISSKEIIIDTALYGNCSCGGPSTGADWDDEQTLDETCFKKHLSHIDQVLDNLKDEEYCSQADFFRSELIKNLKESLSSIYIAEEHEKLLNYIRQNKLINKSTTTFEMRDLLLFLF